MSYQVIQTDTAKYIKFMEIAILFNAPRESSDYLSVCFENECNLILLECNHISADFINLKTGNAGEILQKFTNYNIKAAIIVKGNIDSNPRFDEMMFEYSKGSFFRIFNSESEAVEWLLQC